MIIRQQIEDTEEKILHPKAALSKNSKGRDKQEQECSVRTCYQRDRDRIIHSKSFRRLKHKTQVFFAPQGDHYRTRLTHVLEVSQIGRTIARALRLNEDLVEAIALGHDLGHTPFGHAGEAALNEVNPLGFSHYRQSIRLVECLEKNGRGLNLTLEVRDGILKHSKGRGSILNADDKPITQEALVVRIADIIAYVNHDLDDALRANIIKLSDLPNDILSVIGQSYSGRIDVMVKDVIFNTIKNDYETVSPSDGMLETIYNLRDFLYERVYEHPSIIQEFNKAKKILKELYFYYLQHLDIIKEKYSFQDQSKDDDKFTIASDFVSGMTDRFALSCYKSLFVPNQWF